MQPVIRAIIRFETASGERASLSIPHALANVGNALARANAIHNSGVLNAADPFTRVTNIRTTTTRREALL